MPEMKCLNCAQMIDIEARICFRCKESAAETKAYYDKNKEKRESEQAIQGIFVLGCFTLLMYLCLFLLLK